MHGTAAFFMPSVGWEELVAVAQRSQDADNPRNCLAKQNDPVTIQYCPCIRKAAGRAAFLLRKNVQIFVAGYGDVSARAAICAIWENGLDLFV